MFGPASLEIVFARDAWRALGDLARLSISFQIGPDEHVRIANALSEIFKGFDCLVVADA